MPTRFVMDLGLQKEKWPVKLERSGNGIYWILLTNFKNSIVPKIQGKIQ